MGKEFIEKIAPLVVSENKKRGNPLFSSVVISQAILETGWGESERMIKSNAIFGIKATKTWGGKVYNSKTKECYDGITQTTISASFRAYNSLEESISDYFDLITKSSRYRKACVTSSPLECITAIKNGGYATDKDYIEKIMSIINSNNLLKYDEIETVETVEKDVYKIGNVYKLQVDLKVRAGAGINFKQKRYKELTNDGKKNAKIQEMAVLKKGTKVTCKNIIKVKNEIWLEIPSGFVAGYYDNKYYIK